MYFLLIGLIIIAALLLCFVVMIQNSKGGGLASSFASSNQIMGVRKTTDFIEKMTWSLAGFRHHRGAGELCRDFCRNCLQLCKKHDRVKCDPEGASEIY